MTEECWSSVRGRVARFTEVDDCCKPVAGPCGTITTDGFVSVAYTPEIDTGNEILVRKANGAICVNDKSCDVLKRVNVEIDFCQVSPSIFARMTAQSVVTDFAGNPTGSRIGETIRCDIGFGLEVWSDVPGSRCTTTGLPQYGYFVVPCLTGGTIGDFTLDENAATFKVTAYSRSAYGWGRGPYDVDAQDVDNTPGPLLTPFGSNEHMDMHLTTIVPPEATCECQALTLPDSYTTDSDGDGTFDAYDPAPNDPDVGGTPPSSSPGPLAIVDHEGTAGDADFSWTAVVNATSYQLYKDGVTLGAAVSAPTVTATRTVGSGVSHAYKVRAINAAGFVDSPEVAFTAA